MKITLTRTETGVLKWLGYGYSAKEIGDILGSSVYTIQVHIKNLKEKIGLSKNIELVAYYWCDRFGFDFVEKREQALEFAKQVPTIIIALLMSTAIVNPNGLDERRRFSLERSRTRVSQRIYRAKEA